MNRNNDEKKKEIMMKKEREVLMKSGEGKQRKYVSESSRLYIDIYLFKNNTRGNPSAMKLEKLSI